MFKVHNYAFMSGMTSLPSRDGRIGFPILISHPKTTTVLTNTVLVVHKSDLRHIEPLPLVQLLFVLQYPLVEELLKFLVAVIDAELLEAVHLEVFWNGDHQLLGAQSSKKAHLNRRQNIA